MFYLHSTNHKRINPTQSLKHHVQDDNE